MLRGEIRLVHLDPVRAGESSKTRPAVVVSNDALNATTMSLQRGIVTVVPITSNVKTLYPFQVKLSRGESGLRVDSKAQAEQIRSVAVSRIGDKIGRLSAESQERLDVALQLHLQL
jgi:mRNA interferase MazF